MNSQYFKIRKNRSLKNLLPEKSQSSKSLNFKSKKQLLRLDRKAGPYAKINSSNEQAEQHANVHLQTCSNYRQQKQCLVKSSQGFNDQYSNKIDNTSFDDLLNQQTVKANPKKKLIFSGQNQTNTDQISKKLKGFHNFQKIKENLQLQAQQSLNNKQWKQQKQKVQLSKGSNRRIIKQKLLKLNQESISTSNPQNESICLNSKQQTIERLQKLALNQYSSSNAKLKAYNENKKKRINRSSNLRFKINPILQMGKRVSQFQANKSLVVRQFQTCQPKDQKYNMKSIDIDRTSKNENSFAKKNTIQVQKYQTSQNEDKKLSKISSTNRLKLYLRPIAKQQMKQNNKSQHNQNTLLLVNQGHSAQKTQKVKVLRKVVSNTHLPTSRGNTFERCLNPQIKRSNLNKTYIDKQAQTKFNTINSQLGTSQKNLCSQLNESNRPKQKQKQYKSPQDRDYEVFSKILPNNIVVQDSPSKLLGQINCSRIIHSVSQDQPNQSFLSLSIREDMSDLINKQTQNIPSFKKMIVQKHKNSKINMEKIKTKFPQDFFKK